MAQLRSRAETTLWSKTTATMMTTSQDGNDDDDHPRHVYRTDLYPMTVEYNTCTVPRPFVRGCLGINDAKKQAHFEQKTCLLAQHPMGPEH